MTVIDSRAKVTCNLGEVISGGVNDSFLQNAGLIFTKGQIKLKGVLSPRIGQDVTIAFLKIDGAAVTLDRSLKVLSYFADPFAEVTEVSLGCSLTYADGVAPMPDAQGEASYTTPRQLECLNGLPPSAFTPPIMAKDVYSFCSKKAGFGSGEGGLKNAYMMDKFDLSNGYVSAMASLLLSESKCGYAKSSGNVKIISLSKTITSVLAVSKEKIIAMSGVNSGQLAPDVVIVPYIDKKLEEYNPDESKWDEVETQESLIIQQIDYEGGSVTATHIPTAISRTEYGEGGNLTDQCELSDGGFGDLSDKVIKRVNTRTTTLGVSSPGYASAMLSEGQPVELAREGVLETIQETTYDDKDRPALIVTSSYEPMFVYAGRLSLPWVINGSSISLGSEPILVEQTTEEFEYVGENTTPNGFQIDQDVAEPVVFERRIRRQYQASGRTQGGSQGTAEATENNAFTDIQAVLDHIQGTTAMLMVDMEITSQKRFDPQGEARPGEADRAVSKGTIDDGGRTIKYVEIGHGGNGRVIQYKPPHMPESYFSSGGLPIKVETQAIAMEFGRAQHKLAVGNRLGLNVQGEVDLFNCAPMTAISISGGGFTGAYATNGISFTWDQNGAISSCDALFVGAMGTSISSRAAAVDSVPWFPLPDDYPVDQLPPASNGQVIPPFNEFINLGAGIALGVKATSTREIFLEPKTVELGIAIGVDGTNNTIRQIAEVGVAVGVAVERIEGKVQTVETGIALGTHVEPVFIQSQTVETGIGVGVNLGPVADVPFMLLNFDVDFSDASPNGWTTIDEPAGLPANEYPAIIPSAGFPARFGAGSMYRPESTKASKVFNFSPEQVWGKTWTVEFWLQIFPDLFNPAQPGDQTIRLLGMCGSGLNWNISLKSQNNEASENPWILFQEAMSNGWMYYPNVEGPTNPKMPFEQWVHVAVVADEAAGASIGANSIIRIYQDGIKVAAGQLIRDPNPLTRFSLGSAFYDEEVWQSGAIAPWMIDELRIVVGKAVYTGESFTPPTGAF